MASNDSNDFIAPGGLLMEKLDKPLMSIPSDSGHESGYESEFPPQSYKTILDKYRKLSEEDKDQYMRLRSAIRITGTMKNKSETKWEDLEESSQKVILIWLRNAMKCGSDWCIFSPHVNPMNKFRHCCVPSAEYAWNGETKTLEVRAILPLKSRRDATIDFVRTAPFEHFEKRKYYRRKFNAECRCTVCEENLQNFNPQIGTARLSSMRKNILSQPNSQIEKREPRKNYIEELERTISSLRYANYRGLLLGRVYHKLAEMHWKDMNPHCAHIAVADQATLISTCMGPDHPYYKKTIKIQSKIMEAETHFKEFERETLDDGDLKELTMFDWRYTNEHMPITEYWMRKFKDYGGPATNDKYCELLAKDEKDEVMISHRQIYVGKENDCLPYNDIDKWLEGPQEDC